MIKQIVIVIMVFAITTVCLLGFHKFVINLSVAKARIKDIPAYVPPPPQLVQNTVEDLNTIKTPIQNGIYTLELGRYTNQDEAENMVKKLTEVHINCFYEKKGPTEFVIRSGIFEEETQALAEEKRIQALIPVGSEVVRF